MTYDYTCSECKDSTPFLFSEGICHLCYQKAGNTLTFPQWEAIMKVYHPNPSRAWND